MQVNSRHSAKRPSLDSITDPTVPNPQNPYLFIKTKQANPYKHQDRQPLAPIRSSSSAQLNVAKTAKLPPLRSEDSKLETANTVSQMQQSAYKLQKHIDQTRKFEQIFEAFQQTCGQQNLTEAIEGTFTITLKAAQVTFWQDITSIHLLYSQRLKRTITHNDGLVGYTFFTREIVKVEKANTHNAYSDEHDGAVCPGQTPVLLFPLWDHENNVIAVVEVTRNPKAAFFNEEDEDFIRYFTEKYKLFARWIGKPQYPNDLLLELLQVMELEQFLLLFQRRIHAFFNCRIAELWRYNLRDKTMKQFANDVTEVDPSQAGIVGEAMMKECPLNAQMNQMLSSYMPQIDGIEQESILVVPLVDIRKSMKWAVCLRGSQNLPVFTTEDENMLRILTPYFVTALENADSFSEAGLGTNRNSLEHQCLFGLQKISQMVVDGRDIQEILQDSMDLTQKLTNADRCYLFKFDQETEICKAIVANGVKEGISLHLEKDRGLVGRAFRDKMLINLPEAYDDPDFDSSLDMVSQYKTHSLMTIPVVNVTHDVICVAQLLNRKDGKPFSNVDIGFIRIFSTIFGMLVENMEMRERSTSSMQQLRSFVNVSTALSSNQNVRQILGDIMQNARATIGCERASLFLLDDVVNVLTSYLVDGGKMPMTIPLSHGIAATAVNERQSFIVNDAYHDPRFNKLIDFHTGFKTKSLLAVPIITAEGKCIGVTEMINKEEGIFTQDNLTMLQSFATFSAMLLETRRLKDITERGSAQIEMSKWIGEFERTSYTIPVKLQIPMQKKEEVLSLNFFAIDWNGIGLFKIAFFVFDGFGLLEQFEITNELFFTFLYKLREQYNEPPYHNWIHAIDVLQYISYQVRKINADKILTKFELLAVCIAALCHDAGHEGFNNAYNVNAETPLGILFKNQSVMETHHCTVAIRVLSQPESNIFHKLNESELVIIWKWIIHLILATDMAFHFKLIKQANDALDNGAINLKEEAQRLMAMELIMKVSDISNVSRPFNYADKWCEVLSEEFWRQGDREQELGLEFSSPLNDRRDQNKPKGQVGFYNFVCLPLYTLIARIFPELQVNLDSVKANLEVWKRLCAEQDAAKASEKEKEAANEQDKKSSRSTSSKK